jgi:gas vesicle protein
MNEAKGRGKGLLVGIFSGAAVGSIVALLYAPKSGKKLREDIKTKSQDIIDDTDKYFSDVKEKATKLVKDIKKKFELLVGDTEENIDTLIDESDLILNQSKDKVGSYVRNGKVKLGKESGRLKAAIKSGVEAYNIQKKAR